MPQLDPVTPLSPKVQQRKDEDDVSTVLTRRTSDVWSLSRVVADTGKSTSVHPRRRAKGHSRVGELS